MLARVSGTIEQKFPGRLLLSLGPVALEIYVPLSLYEKLPPVGNPFTLYVTPRLRGENFELYGFDSWQAREFFARLQGISRIGPRLALNILSVFEPEELEEIVAQDDYRRLAKVPGIGLRRAERLCVELRSRLGLKGRPAFTKPPLWSEALSALENLGFSSQEVEKALQEVYTEDKDLSELIKEALKRLSGVLHGA